MPLLILEVPPECGSKNHELELSSSGSGYHISLIFRHAKQAQKPLEGVQAASLPQMKARMSLSILSGSHMDNW